MLNVIKYTNANAIEATWLDAEGEPENCIAYAETQMQMFRDDVVLHGGNIADYTALIADIESKIKPAPILTTLEKRELMWTRIKAERAA